MKKLLLPTFLIIAIFMPKMAMADSVTGNELLPSCLQSVKEMDNNNYYLSFDIAAVYCEGYILGVDDTINSSDICMPNNVNNGQVIRIVTKYLQDNPKDLNQSASVLTLMALISAFPCTNKVNPK